MICARQRSAAVIAIAIAQAGMSIMLLCAHKTAMAVTPMIAATSATTAMSAMNADAATQSSAPRLDARIACSSRMPGSRRAPAKAAADADTDAEYADSAELHLQGDRILGFRWESSLFRRTTGFECSIDESDGLAAHYLPPVKGEAPVLHWRVQLQDARAAREKRGYDADHGFNCSIRIEQAGDRLHLLPSCPALCGSRENFSALTVDLKTGQCEYEH